MQRKRTAAYTLLEVMIIVALLLDLIVIAMPSFLRARLYAQNGRFTNDLRAASAAFEMYATENSQYPPDAPPGVVPEGMTIYLDGFNWQGTNSLGGQWAWDKNSNGVAAAVSVILQSGDDLRMTDIDTQIDDGILATGGFRKQSGTRYSHILE